MEELPCLEVIGDNYQLGKAMGIFSRRHIQDEVEVLHAYVEGLDRYFEMLVPYQEQIKNFFPHLLKEMQGIADGAGVDFEDILLFNTREVYDLLDEARDENWEHCTIAATFNAQGGLIGHNEDWDASAQSELYILKAEMGGLRFLALNYAGTLPGLSASMNHFGLVQCVNELYHSSHQIGIPKIVLARAVLDCATLKKAKELIENTPRATGFNHLLLQGKTLVDVETSALKTSAYRRTLQPFAHTNHYAFSEMGDEEESIVANSIARWRRARELLHVDMSVAEMKVLLRDKQNARHPICRDQATIGSAIFQPDLQLAHICYGPPCINEYKTYGL